jgi:hypothetical protein
MSDSFRPECQTVKSRLRENHVLDYMEAGGRSRTEDTEGNGGNLEMFILSVAATFQNRAIVRKAM